MELLRVWTLRGANRWAPVPVLEAETAGGDGSRLQELALDFQRHSGSAVRFGLTAAMPGNHQRVIVEFEEEAVAQAALQLAERERGEPVHELLSPENGLGLLRLPEPHPGDVYLDFWNGQSDLQTGAVQLTAAPQTLTLQAAVPSGDGTHLQIRTAGTGPVDLDASAASIRLLVPQTSS